MENANAEHLTMHPTKKETDFIRASLTAFNDKAVGADGHTPLELAVYDEAGNVIAGLLGGTYWGWMYVDILWVDEDHRRQGIGSRLLTSAEAEAKNRGCHHVHLDTMSWQAPDFYRKHGYTVIGFLPDIPDGHQKYLMMKQL
ncbi:MAG: GNAT family N-acetyltransferase [Clostridia bacterium]|nr:GNAT family N-acetyltransferase [Clostridia bacterium]